jgi:glycosyltransferase involved in cell wall biosynthesis
VLRIYFASCSGRKTTLAIVTRARHNPRHVNNAPKISAVIIGYNDEPNIRACLESVRWADEIIFADSFSTDATAKIAAEFTDKVVQIKFEAFGKLRNQAVAHATNDWIFSLDTDERATPEIRDEIRALLARGADAPAYFVPRKNFFLGRWIKHCGWYPDYRQPQLFDRRKMRYRDNDLVHESFNADGTPGYLKEHVIQIPFRDIKQFLAKMDRYSDLMAKRIIEKGRRFHAHQLLTHPLFTFVKMYFLRLGFLDGLQGFILSGLYAYYTFIKYVRLWEMTRK